MSASAATAPSSPKRHPIPTPGSPKGVVPSSRVGVTYEYIDGADGLSAAAIFDPKSGLQAYTYDDLIM